VANARRLAWLHWNFGRWPCARRSRRQSGPYDQSRIMPNAIGSPTPSSPSWRPSGRRARSSCSRYPLIETLGMKAIVRPAHTVPLPFALAPRRGN